MEIHGDFRDIVDQITKHLPTCTERYPSSCSLTRTYALKLMELITDQPLEVRRHLLAIMREAQRPVYWGDYSDFIGGAKHYRQGPS